MGMAQNRLGPSISYPDPRPKQRWAKAGGCYRLESRRQHRTAPCIGARSIRTRRRPSGWTKCSAWARMNPV